MKRSNISASMIAVAMMVLLPVGGAVADIGGQVMVRLNVESGCEINGKLAANGNGNDFGMLDFGRTSPTWTNVLTAQVATAGGGLVVTCDASVDEVAVSIDGGLSGSRKLSHINGGTIDYQVYRDAARSEVFVVDQQHSYRLAGGNAVPIPVYGAIPPFSGGAGKEKGLYTDVMTVTLSF
ncbi:Csu type fimbrial protein [Achromobacter kerstersii]|uniref:Spore coat protein U/FanG domain-containing protein n=1 Tax=Achromobacter kerstersii TaxID=1353890 RepID=A0A6S7AH29_9BURK|nr:spore coat U domain-containing protein [Achromobacter kerstersii]CAB3726758.1 hypothetical protein LMG3441_04304 [Achromobacter kerstersii]